MLTEILEINNARIINRNFSGRPGTYNNLGDRNFCVVIDDPIKAHQLGDDGWNVKIKAPEEPGDEPFCFLPIKVKYNPDRPSRNPVIYLRTGRTMVEMDEETVNKLDEIDIEKVDMDIRPFNYDVRDSKGVSAYLVTMTVYQRVDRHKQKWAEEECPEE